MRRRILGGALAAALALTGCGGDEGSGDRSPAELVPGDALVYFEAEIDPAGDQEEAVRSIVEKFPGEGDLEDVVAGYLGKAARETDTEFDYSDDIESWLGDRAGGFVSGVGPNSADAAAVIATEDEDKAREALDKLIEGDEVEHEGVTMRGDDDTFAAVVEGFVVFGNRPGVEAAIDASKEDALEGASRYEEAVDDLPEERLATLFLDGVKLAELTQSSGILSFPREPVAMSIDAEPDAIVAEAVLSGTTSAALTGFFTPSSPLLEEVPAGSWYASAQPDMGAAFRAMFGTTGGVGGGGPAAEQFKRATGIDVERDVASWMGDVAFWVRGTSLEDLTAGLVIDATDAPAARRGLASIARALPKFDAGLSARPRAGGFSIRANVLPRPIDMLLRGDRAVIAYGRGAVDAALDPGARLVDEPRLEEANSKLGEGYTTGTFLDAAPVIAFAESFGLASNPEWQSAKPYLEPFDYVIWGDRKDGDKLRARTRIQLK